MESFIEYDRKLVNDYIDRCLHAESEHFGRITDIMRYSVLGGKRLRGILVLEFGKMLGVPEEKMMPYTMALECVHAYSLIHDDLPCMDNDDYRRGKLSSHKMFGEAEAVLGGDALLTEAFSVIGSADYSAVYPDRAVRIVKCLADYAGFSGMVGGQVLDLEAAENKVDPEKLSLIHSLKTCALIKASCLTGCYAAGAGENECIAAEKYADSFGHAFQIIDDILDSYSDKNEINSAVAVCGMEKARGDAYGYIEKMHISLRSFDKKGYNTENLKFLADFLVHRMEQKK